MQLIKALLLSKKKACSIPVLRSDSVLRYFASDCYWIYHLFNRMKGVNLCIKIVHLWVLLRKWSIIQTSALVFLLAPVSLSLNKMFLACSFLFLFHIFFPLPLNAVGALNEKIEDSLFSSKSLHVYFLQFHSTNREEIAIAYEYKSVSAERNKLFVFNQVQFSKVIVWNFCIAFFLSLLFPTSFWNWKKYFFISFCLQKSFQVVLCSPSLSYWQHKEGQKPKDNLYPFSLIKRTLLYKMTNFSCGHLYW